MYFVRHPNSFFLILKIEYFLINPEKIHIVDVNGLTNFWTLEDNLSACVEPLKKQSIIIIHQKIIINMRK
jgi:hypothetical protein